MNKSDMVLSAIRSIGASFPGASSLVNAWNEHSTNLQLEKCNRLINSLAKDIETMDGRIQRTKKECAEIFGLAMNYAMNDPNPEKMPVYAALILSFCNNSIDKDLVSNLIYECETLLPFDLETLKRIRLNRRIDSAFGFNEKSDHTEVSKCQASIKKLEAKGLVGIGGENNMGLEKIYENSSAWPFTLYQQYYMVLHQGLELLKIIDRSSTQPNG